MNIPDEIIEQAEAARRAPRLHVNDTRHDRIIDMRAAADVIAEWAREEALREAADLAVSNWVGTTNTQGMSYEDAAAWEMAEDIARSIRALAEGDTDD